MAKNAEVANQFILHQDFYTFIFCKQGDGKGNDPVQSPCFISFYGIYSYHDQIEAMIDSFALHIFPLLQMF